jgi:hypothetical protein
VNVRLVTRTLAAGAFVVLFGLFALPSGAVTPGPSCGERLVTNDKGVQIKILFAKNGAVQRYVVVTSQDDMEAVNDMHIDLAHQFGPEAINAPPLRIVSFKPGASGGMMVPDKAVDSCGRTQSFQ